MSFPESLPPRPGNPSGAGLPPASFTGDRRDIPAPMEFIPSIARDLLQSIPPAPAPQQEHLAKVSSLLDFGFGKTGFPQEEGETGIAGLDLPPLFDLLNPVESSTDLPALGSETAFSLQQLSGALLPSGPDFPGAPGTLQRNREKERASRIPGGASFSLADLAGQLSSRLVDQRTEAAGDLLEPETEPEPKLERAWTGRETSLPAAEEEEDLDGNWENLLSFAGQPAEDGHPQDLLAPESSPWDSSLSSAGLPPEPPPLVVSETVAGSGLEIPVPNLPPPPTLIRKLPPPARPGAGAGAHHGDVFLADAFLPDLAVENPSASSPGLEADFPVELPEVRADIHPLFSSLPDLPPPLPSPSKTPPEDFAGAGLLLTLGGAALVLPGLLLACGIPLDWLSLKQSGPWIRQTTEAGMLMRGASAVGLMILGMGSIFQRRWAPPLIHASAWIGALVSSGITAAAAWFWANSEAAEASEFLTLTNLALILAPLLFCLVLILLYQKPEIQDLCDRVDSKTRWTGELPVPGVMVFVCGLICALAATGMMWFYRPAMALAGQPTLTGPVAGTAWAALAILGILSATAALRHSRWALGFLLAGTLLLAVGPASAGLSGGEVWNHFLSALGKSGSPLSSSAASSSSSFVALLTGLSPLPLLLVLAMARRAFSSLSRP